MKTNAEKQGKDLTHAFDALLFLIFCAIVGILIWDYLSNL